MNRNKTKPSNNPATAFIFSSMCSSTKRVTALLTLFFFTSCKQVYICGGFNGNECLITAEVYDATTNQWTFIAPMRSRRSGVGVIAYGNEVYAVREKWYLYHTITQHL